MEQLDLKFRAEPAKPAYSGFPTGWLLLCALCLALGYGIWWTSRHYLARRLSDDLASAQSPADAFLALEGLLMLNSDATLEIARGLQHPNSQIARTAYRTLDAQITGWSQLEASLAAERMRNLSQRLSALPEETPTDNLVLASSLASRIFTICLELDDPLLAPVMTNCEVVFQRVAQASLVSAPPTTVQVADTSAAQMSVPALGQPEALRPPPPLEVEFGNQFTLSDTPARTTSISDSEDEQDPAPASVGLVPPLSSREVVHSSSSTPTAKVQFLSMGTRPRQSSTIAQSISDNDEREQPSIVHGPASVASVPLSRVHKFSVDVDVQNMHLLKQDQLVRLLASVQPQVAQAAALELVAQGWSEDRLRLASELATSLPEQRIELLHSIVSRTDIVDHRPWLLWMAEDGEPEVRRQAVAYLSHMANDIFVQQELRRLLLAESESDIAQSIRRVLLSVNQ